MLESKKYADNIITALREKYNLAVKEFYNTDLNNTVHHNEIQVWFEKIEEMITKDPPLFFVKRLNIFENSRGNVIRIEYEYYDLNDSSVLESTICIYADIE